MSTTVPSPQAPTPRKRASGSSATWPLRDRLGLAAAWFFGLMFCAICAAIIIFVAVQGLRYLRPVMLWTNPQIGATNPASGGFLAYEIGTMRVVVVAMLIAGPLGTAIAVWLTEYGRPAPLARVVESTIEMLAGTPSIVFALFGLIAFATFLGVPLTQTINGLVYGRSFFAGGAMLSLLAVPYVVGAIREGLQAIPNHVREASYALGKTKVATIRRVLLPSARPSVITGTMLGAGHVIGDTAIIVLLVGDTQVLKPAGGLPVVSGFRGLGSTLTSAIFDNAPTGSFNNAPKAYAAAFLLILIILAMNVIVDIFGRKQKELRWS